MREDWFSCNGIGGTAFPAAAPREAGELAAAGKAAALTRRGLLMGAGLSLVAWASTRSALAGLGVDPARKEGNVLVVVFLRGGADGLSLVPPYGEDAYHRSRPSLRLAAPRDGYAPQAERAHDLDGFFGLHPSLAPLLPLYREGGLAAIQACGSGDETRSHFEAMSAMERGLADDRTGPASGWIARHLTATARPDDTPLRAVAFGSVMPDSLRGATHAVSLQTLADYRLDVPEADAARFAQTLGTLYASGKDEAAHAGRQTLETLRALNGLDPKNYRPERGAEYPASDLGHGLREVALLVRADLGLEVACLDKGGWDTHVAQGATTGWFPSLLDDLGRSLAAFAQDLGPEMRRVTVVVMSEFGRRVEENSGLGTDHGHGGAMLVLGGGVAGGKVYGKWPGLEKGRLTGPGDLRVTTDYRDVLGEALRHRLGNARLPETFAGYVPGPVGVVAA